MGSAAGLYSMFRFLGSAIGTALAGVLLTHLFEAEFIHFERIPVCVSVLCRAWFSWRTDRL